MHKPICPFAAIEALIEASERPDSLLEFTSHGANLPVVLCRVVQGVYREREWTRAGLVALIACGKIDAIAAEVIARHTAVPRADSVAVGSMRLHFNTRHRLDLRLETREENLRFAFKQPNGRTRVASSFGPCVATRDIARGFPSVADCDHPLLEVLREIREAAGCEMPMPPEVRAKDFLPQMLADLNASPPQSRAMHCHGQMFGHLYATGIVVRAGRSKFAHVRKDNGMRCIGMQCRGSYVSLGWTRDTVCLFVDTGEIYEYLSETDEKTWPRVAIGGQLAGELFTRIAAVIDTATGDSRRTQLVRLLA